MESPWGHLCLHSEIQGPLATVRGVFDRIEGQPSGRIKVPPFELALRLFASIADGPKGHELQVTVIDAQDREKAEPTFSPLLPFISLGIGYPLLGGARLRFNELVLPGVGSYSFDCSVDGKPVCQIPLTAHAPGDSSVAITGDPATIRLPWLHLVRKYLIPSIATGPGLVSLIDIMDFLTPLPGMKDMNLAGGAIVLQIEAGVDASPAHDLRVELLDGDGQEVLPSFEKRIILRKVAPYLLAITVPVNLQAIVLQLHEGYQVRVSVDDEPLGTPLEIRVVPLLQ